MDPTYEYITLDDTTRRIRLLHLHPPVSHVPEKSCSDMDDDATNAIHCTFSLTSLDDNPTYEALSYVWGELETTSSIFLHGHQHPVTSNLASILRHLRYEDRERVLGIDALCINQSDVNERSHQVAEMHRIYSQAWRVVVFLGEAWEACDTAIELMKFVGKNKDLHWTSSSERSMYSCGFNIRSQSLFNSIFRFFSSPWWTRLWTVQEYVLAKHVEFMCGHHSLDAHHMVEFVDYHSRHERGCCKKTGLAVTGGSEMKSEFLRGTLNFAQSTLLKVLKPSFLEIVLMFRLRECSRPCDKVYGLLGLTTETFRASIRVDFNLSLSEVYQEATLAASNESLHFLSFPYGVSKRDTGPPSWVLDFSSPARLFEQVYQTTRFRLIRSIFTASKTSSKQFARAGADEVVTGAILLDTINDAHCSVTMELSRSDSYKRTASIQACWNIFRLWQSSSEPYASKPEAFWRTLCGGVIYMDKGATSEWEPLSKNADSMIFEKWKAWIGTEGYHIFEGADDSEVDRFNRAFTAVTYGRRFAVSGKGYIGWIPEKARTHDVVVLIPGGNVPYVLRPVGQTSDTYNSANGGVVHRYKILGDAYIHGIMYGEEWDENKLETITLV
ncbi:ankyrin and HET domain-containing protein [Stagonosporopsis vannaccii]|nr:ankyrin and HET domain-containing protein [Stagonosporopsis vannaccii]